MSDVERGKSGNPDEPCWFDTLPEVPGGEKRKIDRLIAAAFQSLAEEVAGIRLHRSQRSTKSPALEELITDRSKEHPTS